MKERTEIRGDPRRIFIFSWKPLLGASEKISLEGGSGPGARVTVAAAVGAEHTRASFLRLDGSEAMRNATVSAKTRLDVCYQEGGNLFEHLLDSPKNVKLFKLTFSY